MSGRRELYVQSKEEEIVALQEELRKYKDKDTKKALLLRKIKNIGLLLISVLWKVGVLVLVVLAICAVTKYFNWDYWVIIGIAVSVFGAIPTFCSIWKKDIADFNRRQGELRLESRNSG